MSTVYTIGWLRYPCMMLLAILLIPLMVEESGSADDGRHLTSMDLRAKDKTKRLEAEQELVVLRKALLDDLVKTFNESEDKTFYGPRHLALKQIGLWRFEEASTEHV